MKRALTIISYCMSALALVGLVACNKTPVEPSPDFDPETNTIKTQLIFSVSTNSASTKMPASTVQTDGNGFRGIDKVHMLTYTLDYTCKHGDYFMFKPDESKANRDFDLGSMVTASSITSENSSRTLELSMPLSVNAIMLYGMAPKTGTNDAQGAVTAEGTALNASLSSLNFSLVNRLKDENAFTGMCNLLSIGMTMITDATLSEHTYGKIRRATLVMRSGGRLMRPPRRCPKRTTRVITMRMGLLAGSISSTWERLPGKSWVKRMRTIRIASRR